LISLPHRLQPIAFRYIIFFAIIAAFRWHSIHFMILFFITLLILFSFHMLSCH
jgi:hypothetical protein